MIVLNMSWGKARLRQSMDDLFYMTYLSYFLEIQYFRYQSGDLSELTRISWALVGIIWSLKGLSKNCHGFHDILHFLGEATPASVYR